MADGIESRHSFSFGEHYDPDNVGFARLLVDNDERVAVGAGFGDHPHRDAEIVTWVLSGSLVHEDSTGRRGVVHPGLAQRLTAGSGVVHAERNDRYAVDPTRPAESVHFVQMWLRPDEPGTVPSYEQRELDLAGLGQGWLPVASGSHADAVISLGTRDSTLWVTELAPGVTRTLPTAPYVHLHVTRGALELEGAGVVTVGDSVRVSGQDGLRVTGTADAQLLVWAMA